MKVSLFLPTRKGSQRVLNKNTRPFANMSGGLLKLKLNNLLKIENIHELILSTDDDESIRIANEYVDNGETKLKIVLRPKELALSTTNLIDLIKYVATICEGDHILWTHVTSPFVLSDDYENAIKKYFWCIDNGFDSLMSVTEFKNFLWDPKKQDIINRGNELKRWPSTQNLEQLFEINSAIFLNSKSNYIKDNDRIGLNPFLLIFDKIKSIDIDEFEDFKLAELIFKEGIST